MSLRSKCLPKGIFSCAEHNVLTALERWVEQGRQPTHLIATKYEGDDPKKAVVRAMPVCPYPAIATYKGKGDVSGGQLVMPRQRQSSGEGGPCWRALWRESRAEAASLMEAHSNRI